MNNRKVLENKDLIFLSKILKRAYNLIDKKLINKFSTQFNINAEASKIIIRRNLVPLTYFFFENLLLVSRYNKKKKNYANLVNFKYNFDKIEDFEESISKQKFNKYFLNFISKIFYVSQKKKNQNLKDYLFIKPKFKTFNNNINNLFILNHNFLIKFFLRLEKYFFRFLPIFLGYPLSIYRSCRTYFSNMAGIFFF